MATILIATVVVLVLGHLAPTLAASVRHYGWFADWTRWLDARLGEGGWRSRWGLGIALAPPLLVVLLFQHALDGPMLGLPALLFDFAILYYCWGPRDLDLDVDRIVQAPDTASRREAAGALWPEPGAASLDGGRLVEAVFRNALRRWFGVLFWFAVLGPFGAALYRLTVVAVEGEASRTLPPETAAGARTLLALLEWPVAQLMTLSLALVGNFDAVLEAWRTSGGASWDPDARFLEAVARACVRSDLAEELADELADMPPGSPPPVLGELPELRDAMSLVWRSLLVWLAVMALFVIAGFVA